MSGYLGNLVALGGCQCCDCPSPILRASVVSKTLSKCGYRALDGSDAWYLRRSSQRNESFVIRIPGSGGCDPRTTTSNASSVKRYNLEEGVCGEEQVISETHIRSCSDNSGQSDTTTDGSPPACLWFCGPGPGFYCSSVVDENTTDASSSIFRSTVVTTAPPGSTLECSGGLNQTLNLTEEYTTSDLVGYAIAFLPDIEDYYPLSFGSPLALRSMTSNEERVYISESEYAIIHRPSPSGCFYASWREETQLDNGQVIHTDREYSWDGMTPEGYDEEDQSTWPGSEYFYVNSPSENGYVTIQGVESTCDCRDFSDEEE